MWKNKRLTMRVGAPLALGLDTQGRHVHGNDRGAKGHATSFLLCFYHLILREGCHK
jgi:hypothetical protein